MLVHGRKVKNKFSLGEKDKGMFGKQSNLMEKRRNWMGDVGVWRLFWDLRSNSLRQMLED